MAPKCRGPIAIYPGAKLKNKKREVSMNKGLIERCHKSSGQIEEWPPQLKTASFRILVSSSSSSRNRGKSPAKKRKCCPDCISSTRGKYRPFGLPRFSNQSGLTQPTTRRWISDQNPSLTVQPWQDCWCPSPSKRLTPQQDLSSSQEGRDVLKNHLLYGPIKGQRRASRKGRGVKKGQRGREPEKKQRGWQREREKTTDRRRGGSSQRRHPLSRQPPSSSASLPATALPGKLVPPCIFNYHVPVTPAGKTKKKERGKPGYWLGPVTRFEPAGPSPACTGKTKN